MSDISFAQFDLLSAMEPTDFVVGYRGSREVRLTYLSLISGISGINVSGTGGGSASGLDVGTLRTFLSTNNVLLSAGTVSTTLSVGGQLFTNQVLTYGTGIPTISSGSEMNLDAVTRISILNAPLRLPNITTVNRSFISPIVGDLIYNPTEILPQIYLDYGSVGDWRSLALTNVNVVSTNDTILTIDSTNFFTYANSILNVRSTAPLRINFGTDLPNGFNMIVMNESTFNVTLSSGTVGAFLALNNILSGSSGSTRLYNSAKVYKYGTNIYKI